MVAKVSIAIFLAALALVYPTLPSGAQRPDCCSEADWKDYDRVVKDPATQKTVVKIKEAYEAPALKALERGDLNESARLRAKAVVEWRNLPHSFLRSQHLWSALQDSIYVFERQGRTDKIVKAYREIAGLQNDPHFTGNGPRAAFDCIRGKKYVQAEEILKEVIPWSSPAQQTSDKILLATAYEGQMSLRLADTTFQSLVSNVEVDHAPLQIHSVRVAYVAFLKRHERQSEAKKLEEMLEDKHCPACKSDSSVLPIEYGLGAGRGNPNVHGGGCCVAEDSPRWFCTKDKLEF